MPRRSLIRAGGLAATLAAGLLASACGGKMTDPVMTTVAARPVPPRPASTGWSTGPRQPRRPRAARKAAVRPAGVYRGLAAGPTGGHEPTARTPGRHAASSRPRRPAGATLLAAGRVLESFAGRRSQGLGHISATRPVVLQWRTAGGSLQLFTGRGFMLVDTRARSGRIRLTAGSYRGLHVAATRPWRIELRAAA